MLLVAVAVALHDLLTDEHTREGKEGSGAFTTVVGEMLEKILVIGCSNICLASFELYSWWLFVRHFTIPSAYEFWNQWLNKHWDLHKETERLLSFPLINNHPLITGGEYGNFSPIIVLHPLPPLFFYSPPLTLLIFQCNISYSHLY